MHINVQKLTGDREHKSMSSNTSDEIFQYSGRENVPKDVTIVHFHSSVFLIKKIDDHAFQGCSDLREIALNEGSIDYWA